MFKDSDSDSDLVDSTTSLHHSSLSGPRLTMQHYLKPETNSVTVSIDDGPVSSPSLKFGVDFGPRTPENLNLSCIWEPVKNLTAKMC